MDKLIIDGPCKLSGEVEVSAAKNATLPIMAATLLIDAKVQFENLPQLSDIHFFKRILESLGAQTDGQVIDCSSVNNFKADYDLVRKMRASVLVLGPLLSRFKKAVISLPGGCAIGSRPVDLHIKGMQSLGAKVQIEGGYIYAETEGLIGADIELDFPSVGATENIIMAAVYAKGITRIKNYAKEPEVIDLINFLQKAGVSIECSEEMVQITGLEQVIQSDMAYSIIGDRIEAATFIIAGVMTKSNITVRGFNPAHIISVLECLEDMNIHLDVGQDYVRVVEVLELKPISFSTEVHPGFPTDVQAQMMTLLASLGKEATVTENIFENRFMHVPELNRMGFNIRVEGNQAHIGAPKSIMGAPVMCTDLRASAALVLGGLIASGTTEVARIYHLDRGYAKLEKKLSDLGANIRRVEA